MVTSVLLRHPTNGLSWLFSKTDSILFVWAILKLVKIAVILGYLISSSEELRYSSSATLTESQTFSWFVGEATVTQKKIKQIEERLFSGDSNAIQLVERLDFKHN